MSERGHFRGGGRGNQRGGRGGHDRGGRGGGATGKEQEKPKKENILDLTKYMHKQVQVKFNGGREGERAIAISDGEVVADLRLSDWHSGGV